MNIPSGCSPPRPEFTTERLPLAIFLHATERLPFMRCDLSSRSGKIMFVFLTKIPRGRMQNLSLIVAQRPRRRPSLPVRSSCAEP